MLATIAAGAAAWLLWSAVAPDAIGPRAAVTPFLCAVWGIFWHSTISVWAVRARPNGLLAKGAHVAVRVRLGWYGGLIAAGAALWWGLS